jgi:homoserine dehydrogenase
MGDIVSTKEIKLALLGFGGVNRTLVELIAEHNANAQKPPIKIVGVSDLFLGHCVDGDGVDCEALLAVSAQKGAFSQLGGGTPDNTAVISDSGADVIAEATFSNMETGEPAISLCEAALLSGKHVITTNKGSVAHGAQRLEALAKDVGRHFLYEGAVMSGSPVLVWAADCFPGAKITRARGILNGTTNFILGEMETGQSFSDALRRAQELGYAEADPTADVEGHDVRAKAIVLAKCLFGETLSIADVPCDGISSITPKMVAEAAKQGQKWKLVAELVSTEGGVKAQVGPKLISADDPLFGISLGTNALELTTDMLGATMVTGPGAGRTETAYAIFSDLLRLANIVSQERELQNAR